METCPISWCEKGLSPPTLILNPDCCWKVRLQDVMRLLTRIPVCLPEADPLPTELLVSGRVAPWLPPLPYRPPASLHFTAVHWGSIGPLTGCHPLMLGFSACIAKSQYNEISFLYKLLHFQCSVIATENRWKHFIPGKDLCIAHLSRSHCSAWPTLIVLTHRLKQWRRRIDLK